MKRLLTSRRPGQVLDGELASIVVGALVVLIMAGIFGAVSRFSSGTEATWHAQTTIKTAITGIQRDDGSAQASFIPASDIANASNADGHELDFYEQNPTTHAGTFWTWCFKAAAGDCSATQTVDTLERYSYAWTALARNGGAGGATPIGNTIEPYNGFAAVEYDGAAVDNIPEVAGYFAQHPASCTQSIYHWGYPNVTSANCRIIRVTITTTTNVASTFALSRPIVAQQLDVVTATVTPTPNPLILGGALTFRAPVAAAQSVTISESNYGTTTTTPPQVYTLGAGCAAYTSVSPASPVTPTNNGTGNATLTVTTIVELSGSNASCSIAVTDNTPQSQAVGVSIGQVYAPGISGTNVSYSPGVQAAVTLTEQNYAQPPPTGRGGFILFGYLPNGSAAPSSANRAGDPNGVCSTAPGSTDAASGTSLGASPSYLETEVWEITFGKAGACYPVFQDAYGQLVALNSLQAIATPTPAPTSTPSPDPPATPTPCPANCGSTSGGSVLDASNLINFINCTQIIVGVTTCTPAAVEAGGSITFNSSTNVVFVEIVDALTGITGTPVYTLPAGSTATVDATYSIPPGSFWDFCVFDDTTGEVYAPTQDNVVTLGAMTGVLVTLPNTTDDFRLVFDGASPTVSGTCNGTAGCPVGETASFGSPADLVTAISGNNGSPLTQSGAAYNLCDLLYTHSATTTR